MVHPWVVVGGGVVQPGVGAGVDQPGVDDPQPGLLGRGGGGAEWTVAITAIATTTTTFMVEKLLVLRVKRIS